MCEDLYVNVIRSDTMSLTGRCRFTARDEDGEGPAVNFHTTRAADHVRARAERDRDRQAQAAHEPKRASEPGSAERGRRVVALRLALLDCLLDLLLLLPAVLPSFHPFPVHAPLMSSHNSSSSNNVVGAHYRVGKKIGEGSFGVIFEGMSHPAAHRAPSQARRGAGRNGADHTLRAPT